MQANNTGKVQSYLNYYTKGKIYKKEEIIE